MIDKKPPLVETVAFDTLKIVAHILLPLSGALYFAFAGALSLPQPEDVVGGLATAATILSGFIKTNEVKYNASDAKFDGVVNVIQTDAKKVYQLALNTDPNLIDQAEKLVLKVVKPQPAQPPQVEWEMNQVVPPSNSTLPGPQVQQPRG